MYCEGSEQYLIKDLGATNAPVVWCQLIFNHLHNKHTHAHTPVAHPSSPPRLQAATSLSWSVPVDSRIPCPTYRHQTLCSATIAQVGGSPTQGSGCPLLGSTLSCPVCMTYRADYLHLVCVCAAAHVVCVCVCVQLLTWCVCVCVQLLM